METSTPPQGAPASVECRAAKDPAVRLLILAAMLLGYGAYCFVDAYIRHLPEKTETINDVLKYWLNHGGGIVLPLLGIVVLVKAVAFLRRKLIADETGIGYVGKDKIGWEEVTSLDTSKFEKKGVLGLRYSRGGKEGTLVLDSWKLNNFRELLKLVEAKVPFALPQ